jgi:hypothetical protein
LHILNTVSHTVLGRFLEETNFPADGIEKGLEWRFPKWLLVTDNSTRSEAQSETVATSSGGEYDYTHLKTDCDADPSKSNMVSSSTETVTTALPPRKGPSRTLSLDVQALRAENGLREQHAHSQTW